MSRWGYRIVVLLMLLFFIIIFVHMHRTLVALRDQRNQPPATTST